MTYQEAYKIIQDDIKILARKNGKDIPDWLFAASAALEKQIAKKPKLKKKDWGHIRYYEVCPICENVVIYNSSNYCEKCGQRLDWSDIQ